MARRNGVEDDDHGRVGGQQSWPWALTHLLWRPKLGGRLSSLVILAGWLACARAEVRKRLGPRRQLGLFGRRASAPPPHARVHAAPGHAHVVQGRPPPPPPITAPDHGEYSGRPRGPYAWQQALSTPEDTLPVVDGQQLQRSSSSLGLADVASHSGSRGRQMKRAASHGDLLCAAWGTTSSPEEKGETEEVGPEAQGEELLQPSTKEAPPSPTPSPLPSSPPAEV